jgi:flagellar hook-associated protein 1 FlgK
MASLFGVLDVAGRGLLVAQRGVHVAGHNIANAETPGYSRQRPVLAATRPLLHPTGHLGQGVEQLTIERVTDRFVQGQLVRQGGALGSTQAQAEALALLQEVFNEQGAPGLSAALSRLYDAFSDLAASPTPGAPVEREAVRSAARALLDGLHGQDARLRELQRGTDAEIEGLLPQVNDLATRIEELNREIVRQEVMAPANDLRDRRELLVRELAGLVDVRTYEDGRGALVVTLGNGLPLVEGGSARRLVAVADPGNPFDPTFAVVRYQDGANDVDVTADIGGGRLGGLLRSRDTLIPAAIRSLDTLAYNLAASVNAVHNAGVGLNGASGDFFAPPAAVEDSARDLALAPTVLASADAIAAGLGPAPGDNRNAVALAALRDTAAPLFLPGDPPGPASGPSRTLLEHVAAVAADVGTQARSLELSRQQQARLLEGLENRRDEVSGVSLDEEVTHLIRLQAAFQANSRVVGVVDRLLQDVIDLL